MRNWLLMFAALACLSGVAASELDEAVRRAFPAPEWEIIPTSIDPDATIKVRLKSECVGPLRIPASLGVVEIDLDGYGICGSAGVVGSASVPGGQGGNAVEVYADATLTGEVSRIRFVSDSAASIRGGDGGDGNSGGAGGAGILICPEVTNGATVDVGEGISVAGGKGGDGIGVSDGRGAHGGDGGDAIRGDVGTAECCVGGAGGKGADYAAGQGGDGGNGGVGDEDYEGEGGEGGDGDAYGQSGCAGTAVGEMLIGVYFPAPRWDYGFVEEIGCYCLTLHEDVSGSVRIPDNLGRLLVDLNGYKIVAPSGADGDGVSPGGNGGSAIAIYASGRKGDATHLGIENEDLDHESELRGGDGGRGNAPGSGGDGVSVEAGVKDEVAVEFSRMEDDDEEESGEWGWDEEDVGKLTVRGGRGGDAVGADESGDGVNGGAGGCGVRGKVLENVQTLIGGDGGDGGDSLFGAPGSGGDGGKAISEPDPGIGTNGVAVVGRDGQPGIAGEDKLKSLFGGKVQVEGFSESTGSIRLRLTESLTGGVCIPDGYGDISLDLAGFSITGLSGANGSYFIPGGDGENAIRLAAAKIGPGGFETMLNIVNTAASGSSLIGGNGGDGRPAGRGAAAIVVDEALGTVADRVTLESSITRVDGDDGTRKDVEEWIEFDLPAEVTDLVYNGLGQVGVVTQSGYTVTGLVATNAGYHIARATLPPKLGYRWKNGTTNDVEIGYVISPAPLKVTARDAAIDFGAPPPAFAADIDGFVGGETAAVLDGELRFRCDYSAGDKAGDYGITPFGLVSANYAIDFIPGTLLVGDHEIEVPNAVVGLVYNGHGQQGVLSGTGYRLSGEVATNAGDHVAMATPKKGYSWVGGGADPVEVRYSIAKAALTVKAADVFVSADGGSPKYRANVTGLRGNDDAASVLGELTFSCDYIPGAGQQTYTITVSGVTSTENYEIAYVPGVLTVEKSSPVDLPQPWNFTYCGSMLTPVPASIYYDLSGAVATNAGDYVATVTLKSGYVWSDGETNRVRQVPYTIGRATLPVYADPCWKLPGENDPALTFHVTNWKGEDGPALLTGALERENGGGPGSYRITLGTLSAGDNYEIYYHSANLTIYDPSTLPVKCGPGGVALFRNIEDQVAYDRVAGTDPEDRDSLFRVAIEMVDGKPKITVSPDLGSAREYRYFGSDELSGAEWHLIEKEEDFGNFRFFKVSVSLPGNEKQ